MKWMTINHIPCYCLNPRISLAVAAWFCKSREPVQRQTRHCPKPRNHIPCFDPGPYRILQYPVFTLGVIAWTYTKESWGGFEWLKLDQNVSKHVVPLVSNSPWRFVSPDLEPKILRLIGRMPACVRKSSGHPNSEFWVLISMGFEKQPMELQIPTVWDDHGLEKYITWGRRFLQSRWKVTPRSYCIKSRTNISHCFSRFLLFYLLGWP